jgi:hypothetical protein
VSLRVLVLVDGSIPTRRRERKCGRTDSPDLAWLAHSGGTSGGSLPHPGSGGASDGAETSNPSREDGCLRRPRVIQWKCWPLQHATPTAYRDQCNPSREDECLPRT